MVEHIGNVTIEYNEKNWVSDKDNYHECEKGDDVLEFAEMEKIAGGDIYESVIKDSRWPVLYHFSNMRKSILEWFDFSSEATLLEVGADCGALTELYCQKVKKVVGIDTSYKRLKVNAIRNSQYDNLELVACDIQNYDSDEKFDYITLIGVLEYADYLFDCDGADSKFISKLKELLKPGGKIIIAVRNKYGLKYWAGAVDEYSGEMFDTIKGENALAKAYSLNNIKSVLENEGLNKLTFYYPLPDYIIPTEIFSDDFLPKSGDMHDIHNSFKHERYNLFSEAKAYESICKDGLFPQFANSYLIISEMEND